MLELKTIIEKLQPVAVVGNWDRIVTAVNSFDIENTDESTISWLNQKNSNKAYLVRAGVVLIPTTLLIDDLPSKATFLTFENPREAFSRLIQYFFMRVRRQPGISSSAIIGGNVKFGANVFVGHNTVIEDNVKIGDNVTILHNNSILSDTIIGNGVSIGSNNTIGGVGFGYERNKENQYEVIPHIGNVVIEDLVEIGNNTCIDRAVLGSTIIRRNAKIDNLVHIAHGCEIGENSLVIAHAMIGGSSLVGKNVWIAPNAAIINKISIGDNTVIGMGAVVLSNVSAHSVMVGNPAKPIEAKK